MKIEKVNDHQIRCTLTQQDLASRHLKLSELAYGTEKAKMLFQDMMQHKKSDIVCVCYENVLSSKISRHPQNIPEKHIEHMNGRQMLNRLFETKKNAGDLSIVGMLIKREFYEEMQKLIREAETVLPQNYLNDVYCVPRFFYNAKSITLLNNAYILRRISKYTDSRLLRPNALHYELALVNKMNLDYYKQCGCRFAYEKHIIGFYLVILKLWYQIITCETDVKKQQKYVRLIQKYYKEYYSDLKKVKSNTIKEYLVKWTIMLWGIDRTLWKITVGNMRYGIMYRLQT